MHQFVPSENHLISKIIEGIHLQLCPLYALIDDPPHPSGANRIYRVDVVLFCYFTSVYMNHSRIWDVDKILYVCAFTNIRFRTFDVEYVVWVGYI